MINDPPDSAARFAASRSARADESKKTKGTNIRRGSMPAGRGSLKDFVLISFVLAQQFQQEERQLLTSLHGAKQRATPTLAIPGPSLVAGECRRRSGRCFAGSPFCTGSLPAFPRRVRRCVLYF